MEDFKDLKDDIKDIKKHQENTSIQLERYNTLLGVHIKRTELLEERIVPIEDHVKFLRKLAQSVGWIMGLIAATLTVIHKLFK